MSVMNQLLERALTAVRKLPSQDQEDIARVMLDLAERDNSIEQIDPNHLGDVLESLGQLRRKEFASDSAVQAAFASFER